MILQRLGWVLLSCSLLSANALTIADQNYTAEEVHIGITAAEWEEMQPEPRARIVNEFIRKKTGELDARELKLDQHPNNRVKLRNQQHKLLVNQAYETFVARPLAEEVLDFAREHISEEVLVHHILIGYAGCSLRKQFDRSEEDARIRAEQIIGDYRAGEDFVTLARTYSDDPSVLKNDGELGWLQVGQTVEEFQEAAFTTPAGELSGAIRTDFGYHILFVQEKRESKHANMEPEILEKVAYQSARNSITYRLREAAEKYDAQQILEHGIQFNNNALIKILDGIEKERNKSKVVGNIRIDIVATLEALTDVGVVCLLDGNGYGIKWFADRLDRIPPTRHPELNSIENIENVMQLIVLQELAVKKAFDNDLTEEEAFLNSYLDYENHILFDSYVKYIVNSTPEPTEEMITQYYQDHLDEKFKEGEKVSVLEIKVRQKGLIDSLYGALVMGSDFEHLAREFSLTNPREGGRIAPFTQGKYNKMGELAFQLEAGSFSEPVENLDGTWSVVYLVETLPEGYQELDAVRTRITQVLKRELQSEAKENQFESLRQKYNVQINPDFFQYPTESTDAS